MSIRFNADGSFSVEIKDLNAITAEDITRAKELSALFTSVHSTPSVPSVPPSVSSVPIKRNKKRKVVEIKDDQTEQVNKRRFAIGEHLPVVSCQETHVRLQLHPPTL